MSGLIACPFCREMFKQGEAKVCPACGLRLEKLDDLPPAKVHGDELAEEIPPDEEKLPFWYWARGRGALLLLSLAGLVAFFLPWGNELMPEKRTLTGADFASHLGWMWAPLVAWMVMIPLVASRRSIYRMRGARVATGFLSGIALITVAMRIVFVPHGTALDPHRFTWSYGLYLTGAIALAAVYFSIGFGGPIDKLSSAKTKRPSDATLH
jgi:hypothetical protein